jgi:hypothetical protein
MRVVLAMAALLSILLIPASPAYGADPTREEMKREVKIPETPADHVALAKYYDEKAAELQRESEYHQGMAAEYKKSRADSKDAAAMERHCAMIAKDAQDMAKEAKIMADYHRLRGK